VRSRARFFIAVLAACPGCAAFVGYVPETPAVPLPDELRANSAFRSEASVDLSAGARNHGAAGFTSQRTTSLSEVIAVARESANAVLEAAARLDAASGRVQSADGALLPGVDVRLGGRYLDGREVGSFGEVRDGVSFGRFEPATGVFYRVNPGAALARSARWRREADAAALDVREAERSAMLQAGIGYLDLAVAYASHQIAERLVEDAGRFVAITRARAAAEIGAGADVARAEVDAARARQAALGARGRREQASIRLAVLLRWPTAELLLPGDAELRAASLIDTASADRLYEEAERARPDIGAAGARARAVQSELTAAWLDLFGPEIDATLRERLIGTKVDDLDNTHLVHGLAGFALDFDELGRTRTARGEARAAAIREQTRREEARGEIESAISNVRTSGAAVPEARSAVEAAERSYRIQLARFEIGTGLGIEIIEAQNAQARARLELAEAIVRYNVAQIELAASIGHLTPALVAEDVKVPPEEERILMRSKREVEGR
jgi:outer membrane protein TolC